MIPLILSDFRFRVGDLERFSLRFNSGIAGDHEVVHSFFGPDYSGRYRRSFRDRTEFAVEFIDSMMIRMIPKADTDEPGMPCPADDADIVALPEEIEGLIYEGQSIDQFASWGPATTCCSPDLAASGNFGRRL